MFSSDIVSLGENAGFGVFETTIFKGPKAKLPAGPGPLTKISLTGGGAPEGTHNMRNQPAYINPSAQISVHAAKYDDAMALAVAWRNLLYSTQNVFVDGTWWRQVRIHQDPFDLPPDEAGRNRVAFNFDATIRPSVEASA